MDVGAEVAVSEEEMELLLEQLHPSCFGWALVCCRWNRDEAQEVLQSAYLKILEGRARPDGCPNRRTWVLGVIRRTASEQRRQRLTQTLLIARWLRRKPEPARAVNPEDLSADFESRRRLRRMLERLSARQRGLLHLVFYQDMTIEEASEVLGISLGAARVHYERGKARLRKLLIEQQVTQL